MTNPSSSENIKKKITNFLGILEADTNNQIDERNDKSTLEEQEIFSKPSCTGEILS